MPRKSRATVLIFIATATAMLLCIAVLACAQSRSGVQDAASVRVPKPKPITPADLSKLRWIEGTWRGTGDVEAPFYERYRFENETTLVVESFDDEKVDKVTDVTRFELKDGQFGNYGEGARWVATQLENNSVTFEPVTRARNSFRWQKESENLWKAILDWPAADSKPARQRVYKMERWPTAKQ